MFYDAKMRQNTVGDMINKVNIRELIEFERYCRDYKLWDKMRSCYHDDCRIVVSWRTGSPDKFIKGSKRMNASKAPAKHKIFNTLARKNGEQAVAECITSIQIRCPLDGDIVDMATHTRFHYRPEKCEGIWKILPMEPIYEKHTLTSAYTDGTFLANRQELEKYRPSYANLILLQVHYVLSPNEELAGENRPENIEEIYKKAVSFSAYNTGLITARNSSSA